MIKIQKNSRNERLKIGDKHDGILYMNLYGENVQIGFVEVAGNAFNKDPANCDNDLTKLLKGILLNFFYMSELCLFRSQQYHTPKRLIALTITLADFFFCISHFNHNTNEFHIAMSLSIWSQHVPMI